MILTVLGLILVGATSAQQLISPCPKSFAYEPLKAAEPDRWYGQLTLISESDLNGVWIRVVLDRPSLQLGNWFGDIERRENNEYVIKKPSHSLKAYTPLLVRFFVQYSPGTDPPRLIGFRLNAKTLCPEAVTTTALPQTSAQPLTSEELIPTPSLPNGFNPGSSSLPEDVFTSDFAFNNPNKKPPLLNLLSDTTCGTVVTQPRPLITHGIPTNEAEFPWHAALYYARGVDLTYICGASLITRQHVLTVSHCVAKKNTNKPLNPAVLLVYFGKYYLRQWNNAGLQDRQVQNIIIHPNYDPQVYSNDIAILKLKSPATITNYVRTVCLWEGEPNLNPIINKLGTVVGWGFDESGKVQDQLSKAQMPIIAPETCIYSNPDFFGRFTSAKTFCAGFRNGTSVCNGDSGGGMVFEKGGSRGGNPIWQIRGLVSISVAVQNEFKCDASHYAVFTDVAKYLDWIKANLN